MTRRAGIALVFLTWLFLLLIYAPGITEDFFVIDDSSLIAIPQVRAPMSVQLVKTWVSPGAHIDYYPLRDLSYWTDVHVFRADPLGLDARVYRLQNFAWMLAAALLLYWILLTLEVSPAGAALGSAIWLAHPVHSEMLMWASARKDCMALTLGLGAVLAFLRLKEKGRKNGWAWLCLGLYSLSLLCKASLLLLPLVIPVIGIARGRRKFLVAAVILGALAAIIQSRVYSQVTDMRFLYSWDYRVQASAAALGRMTLGWLWPPVNAVDVENWGDWASLNSRFLPLGVLVWIGALALVIWAWRARKNRWLVAGVAFWLTYLPISSLVFPHRNFYSIRYLEVPMVALWIAAVTTLSRRGKLKRSVARVVTAGLFMAVISGSIAEARVWSDGVRPFVKGLKVTPGSPSLERMAYDTLSNVDRWGRLTASDKELMDQLLTDLRRRCGPAASDGDYRNSHLCLFAWMDEFFRKPRMRNLNREELLRFIRLALARVNSTALQRQEARIRLANEIHEKHQVESAPDYRLLSQSLPDPERRLKWWMILCLSGRQAEARDLLAHWEGQALMDSLELTQFLADTRLSPVFAPAEPRLKSCR